MKKILITGAGSYVGESVRRYILAASGDYVIDAVDTMGDAWRKADFSKYDVVYHVAGIAHVNADPKMEALYYRVNRDLTIEVAKAAKAAGVKQFIFMSSQIVFHESRSLKTEVLTKETKPAPNGFYGDSKLQAEIGLKKLRGESLELRDESGKLRDESLELKDESGKLRGESLERSELKGESGKLRDESSLNQNSLSSKLSTLSSSESSPKMKICILRPCMIYGPNAKGNFPRLAKLATVTPIFPAWHNKRSMLYIDNLAEFVKQAIDRELEGTFYPQNRELADTVEIIRFFAKAAGHRVWITRLFNPLVWLGSFVLQPLNKMFATYYYDPEMSKMEFEYQLVSFEESLKRVRESLEMKA